MVEPCITNPNPKAFYKKNKNMRLLLPITVVLLIFSTTLPAQNAYDSNGKRTGPWKGYYNDTTLRYEAIFNDGKPVGQMRRYDPNGSLAVTMDYYSGTDRCFTRMYDTDGSVRAEGVYDNREKDSTWIYMDRNGTVTMKEHYENGVLSGVTETYYPSGKRAQQLHYDYGEKHGPWIRFFENGDTMLKAHYVGGMLHGEYLSLYPGGKVQIAGNYHKDLKDGDWNYYSEEGDSLTVLKYDKGRVLNPEVMEKQVDQFLRMIEENEGTIPDPALPAR